MKKDIHPPYREVLFVDSSTNEKYLIGTTLQPKGSKTEVFEGREYPVQMVDVSRSSHPFFNNQKGRFLDSEGRVNKFYKRYPKKASSTAPGSSGQQAKTTPQEPSSTIGSPSKP